MLNPYFDQQPPFTFIDDLRKPYHRKRVLLDLKPIPSCGCADVKGMYLEKGDFDAENLKTAFADFSRFLTLNEIAGEHFPVRLQKNSVMEEESYEIVVEKDVLTITAGDTEGIRRALVYVEDELVRAGGAFLPLGAIRKRPFIKRRISRSFFAPTNRPPKNIDELYDDVDYYPDEYLNCLAHHAVNGVWIYTRFSDLCASACFPENGVGSEKRIEKLRGLIKKCAAYGIKVYVFLIEPHGFSDELRKTEFEGDAGTLHDGVYTFCTHTEKGRAYCIEMTEKICRALPGLGGILAITTGERTTACAGADPNTCPVCKRIPRGENLSQSVDCLREGMRRAGTGAELISWTYGHRFWKEEDIRDYVRTAPDDVALMQNFEEVGYDEQLGKQRQAIDYWLSYPGPSQTFVLTADAAKTFGKTLFAKMQICCSHEIASVPYIPVPGLIFEKFKGAKKTGVTGVMECWYFGNYPSVMSKAAGEAAFWEDFDKKDVFLRRLAGAYFGKDRADDAVCAWKFFEAGYRKYPLNIMFSYYGPMHDAVSWELSLEPKNLPLSRSWRLEDRPCGDRICESLLYGHTLDEAIALLETMADEWKRGIQESKNVFDGCEMRTVIEALAILLESGCDILKFYALRDKLGRREGNAAATLGKMRAVVENEKIASERMKALCLQDARLGYHSEAEGYKFFPRQLDDRVLHLDTLLKTEFVKVEERIKRGLSPLAYYDGEDGDAFRKRYRMTRGKIQEADWETIDDTARFRIAYDNEHLYLEIGGSDVWICPEFELFKPYPAMRLSVDGTVATDRDTRYYFSVFGERHDELLLLWKPKMTKDGVCVALPRKKIGWTRNVPFKMRLIASSGVDWCDSDADWCTLGKGKVDPYKYGWCLV